MRETKFRGKRKDNNEWVYGSLISSGSRAWMKDINDKYTNPRAINSDWADFRCVEVIPETVGQYTGLKDSSGKSIYEGDVVRIREDKFGNWETYKIEYHGDRDYPAFDTVPSVDCDSNGLSHAMACCNIEVIGNIFEDSDLLKEVCTNV